MTTVRLGHLCWDSYEPEEGVYLVNREYLNETDKPMCFLEFQTGRPAVSVHRYGKGKAYYVAAETDSELLRWLLRGLETEIGLQPALRVPHGVQARQIAENQCFYVNTTAKPVSIPLAQGGRAVRFPYGGGFQCNSKEKSICLTQSRCFLVTRTGIEPMLQP